MTEQEIGRRKKAMIVTTIAATVDKFCRNDIFILQNTYEVHIAANFSSGNNESNKTLQEFKTEMEHNDVAVHEVDFKRNPLHWKNASAYKEISRLIRANDFDIIHCHTPVAAALVRFAARKARIKGTKVIYTAHGFHFYRGAPVLNWLIYYPIELFLAKHTDILITINKEDYQRAKKSFGKLKIEFTPGVGINPDKFCDTGCSKEKKRKELELPNDAFIMVSVGELNKNKNHKTVIRALAQLKNPQIQYIICGQGALKISLEKLIKKLGLINQVHLLGFREDVAEIYKAADVFVLPSFREGLSVALMEAMASGLPIICSKIRGNTDLIEEGKGGYLVASNDVDGFADAINRISHNEDIRRIFKCNNTNTIGQYSIDKVQEKMLRIYEN